MDQVDTKYPKRFLKLTAKSTEEDAMMAYDEWAKTYEEVHYCNVSYQKKNERMLQCRELLLTVESLNHGSDLEQLTSCCVQFTEYEVHFARIINATRL